MVVFRFETRVKCAAQKQLRLERENSLEIPVGAKKKETPKWINNEEIENKQNKDSNFTSFFSPRLDFLSAPVKRVWELIPSINNQLASSCDDIIVKLNKRINDENS